MIYTYVASVHLVLDRLQDLTDDAEVCFQNRQVGCISKKLEHTFFWFPNRGRPLEKKKGLRVTDWAQPFQQRQHSARARVVLTVLS